MTGLSMCSITMFVFSGLSAMSLTVCQMQNSSPTTRIPNIQMTTCSLCCGESASSLSLMPPAILCFASFRKEVLLPASFISSPS